MIPKLEEKFCAAGAQQCPLSVPFLSPPSPGKEDPSGALAHLSCRSGGAGHSLLQAPTSAPSGPTSARPSGPPSGPALALPAPAPLGRRCAAADLAPVSAVGSGREVGVALPLQAPGPRIHSPPPRRPTFIFLKTCLLL